MQATQPPTVNSHNEDGQQQQLYQETDGWRRCSMDRRHRSQFVQQVLEANKDADSPCDFVCRVAAILSTTVAATVLMFVALTIPVVMIAVGVKYLNDCPLENRIPVYLLVGGCFLAIKLLGMLWVNLRQHRYDSMDAFHEGVDDKMTFTYRTLHMMDWILPAFLFAWHVAGAFWVFALWLPPFQPHLHQPKNYCGKLVYMCALSEILTAGSLLALALISSGILALCYRYTNIFNRKCCDMYPH